MLQHFILTSHHFDTSFRQCNMERCTPSDHSYVPIAAPSARAFLRHLHCKRAYAWCLPVWTLCNRRAKISMETTKCFFPFMTYNFETKDHEACCRHVVQQLPKPVPSPLARPSFHRGQQDGHNEADDNGMHRGDHGRPVQGHVFRASPGHHRRRLSGKERQTSSRVASGAAAVITELLVGKGDEGKGARRKKQVGPDVQQLVVLMMNTFLKRCQAFRHVESVVYPIHLAPRASHPVQPAWHWTKQYPEATKKKGHGLGSPHVYAMSGLLYAWTAMKVPGAQEI